MLRRFQVAFAVARQQPAGGIERAVIADAGEDVEDLALLRASVLRALGCQQRKLQTACQLDCSLIAGLLRAVIVALQLNINIFSPVKRDQPLELRARLTETAALQCVRQRTFVAPSQTDEAGRIFGEIGEGSRRLVLNQFFSLTLWYIVVQFCLTSWE